MIVAAAWIDGGWIYSADPEQDAKYEIHDGWIWGPYDAEDRNTGYWIGDGWIWGPVGAEKVHTGFYVAGNWIYGPSAKLPFVKRTEA